MSASRLFGTDGIRDIAGRGNLSPERIVRIGRAVGYVIQREPELLWPHSAAPGERSARVVTTRDTRASGHMIEGALRAGLLSTGVEIAAAEVLPTPVCSFLVRKLNCTCGIVISASHNPNEYNGIKLFDAEGFKISSRLENRIEELVNSPEMLDSLPTGMLGGMEERRDSAELYVSDAVARTIESLDLRGMKIIIDCANGAVTEVAPTVFDNLGAEIFAINAAPDGSNINENSGALHPGLTAQTVKDLGAHIGFSFDGDGDRVIFVDENGVERDGDYAMAICGRHFKEKGMLPANTVVTTVMANIGLELSLHERGIEMVRTQVGDRFVTEELLRLGATLGGEQSGHVLFLDKAPTGDGIWTALTMLQIMSATGKTLSQLSSCMKKFPQILLNVEVKSKPPLESVPEVEKARMEADKALAGQGRVVLRYSGTEQLARVMVEGPDLDIITKMARSIARTLEDTLG
jgi:phosphoglucosamine mutase